MIHTAEETLKRLGYIENDPEISFVELSELIKVIQRETIIECAEMATIIEVGNKRMDMPTGSQFKTTPVYVPVYEVSKQSILNLLDQIK